MAPAIATNRAPIQLMRALARSAVRRYGSEEEPILIVPLGARSREALRRQLIMARTVLSHARGARECEALCEALAHNSSQGDFFRIAVLAESAADLQTQLQRARLHELGVQTVARERPRLVFVCSGQGSQWAGMARTLLAQEPAFRTAMQACDRAVYGLYGFSILELLSSDQGCTRLDASDAAQLSIASIQLALGALWRSWGVVPDALIGHSLGEVTACGLSGILSLEDTLRVVGARAKVLRENVLEPGGMLVVTLPEGRTSSGLLQLSQELDVAAYNSPNTLVVSGSNDAIRRIEPQLRAEGFRPERVHVSYASHCAHVDACLSSLRASLEEITPRAGTIPVRGTSREGWLVGPRCGPAFWAQNLRNAVRFRQAVEATVDRPTIFVELSPHPLLLESIVQTSKSKGVPVQALASCRRGEHEQHTMHRTLANLFCAGFEVDWSRVFRATSSPARTDSGSETLAEEGRTVVTKNNPWIVRRTAHGKASVRLFCFPHAGAGSVIFRDWHADFPDSVDVCAIEPPGRLARRKDRSIGDVHEFAHALDAALEGYLDLPFAFFGYSLGALMAFEAARLLRRRRRVEPQHLIVAAHKAPQAPQRCAAISREPDAIFVRELERRYGPFDAALKADPDLFQAIIEVMRVDLGMLESYRCATDIPFSCPILAIGGTADASMLPAELESWRQHTTARFRAEWLAGGHFFLRDRGKELRQLVRGQLGSAAAGAHDAAAVS